MRTETAIEFYSECRAQGVNPVIGYEAYVAPGDRRDKKKHSSGENYYHLTLLAKNNVGFKNLIKLSSLAFLEGFYYAPRIDLELLAAHADGLICLSGCLAGQLNQHILRGRERNMARKLQQPHAKQCRRAGAAAGPVYKLLGKRDPGTNEFPAIETGLMECS